jgi:hypothetical protein
VRGSKRSRQTAPRGAVHLAELSSVNAVSIESAEEIEMVHKEERERHERKDQTIKANPKPGGRQEDKSHGNGDADLEKASVGGHARPAADDGEAKNRRATQDPPDDGGFTEDSPNEHG